MSSAGRDDARAAHLRPSALDTKWMVLRKGIGPADKTGQEALLSKDHILLRQVGSFFYGEEWQAPLARDLRVNERSLRRWLAGTEKIPRGIWRDFSISFRASRMTPMSSRTKSWV
jgi:hypothetical protein